MTDKDSAGMTDALQLSKAGIATTLRLASNALASDPAWSAAAARKVIEASPGNIAALAILGAALRAQGDLDAASIILKPLAATQKTSWNVQFELARVFVAQGCSRAAIPPLTRAVALNPDLTLAWRLLGDILLTSGEALAARNAYDRRIRSMIRDPRLQKAADALAEDRLDAAEAYLRGILASQSAAEMAATHLLGEVLRRRGRLTDAGKVLSGCLERTPDFFLARQSYALSLHGERRFSEALVELDRLLARDPSDNRTLMMKAAALTQIGDYDTATKVTARVLGAFPDQPRAWLVHGDVLRTLGRIDEAVAAYRKCIELEPGYADAFWCLANLKTFRFTAGERAAMSMQLKRKDLAAKDRASLQFAMGKAAEDAESYAKAFDHYARANATERERRPYKSDDTSARVLALRTLFTKEFFAERAGWGAKAADPIFIVGMPRSGSTLVDQILASHSMVEGTRELPDIEMIADAIAGARKGEATPQYSTRLAALAREATSKLGRLYLERTRAHRRGGQPRFSDKAPENFFHIGLIQLVLPNAKIVDVRRNPMACCWSVFRQHFASGFAYSYNLTDLGRFYGDYVELMAHFDEALPGRVHRVIYEDLVENTEAETRRLLDYLGLPFEPACLRFFETNRAISTPSSEQVRQPIFTDGIDHWRRFEPWLDPLKEALGPAFDRYLTAPPAI